MTERRPAVRASAVKDALFGLTRLGGDTLDRVKARIPATTLELVESSARTAWIPAEHDRWVPGSIIAELGREPARKYFRAMLPTQLQSPLLSTVLGASQRLFGLTPASLAWAAAKAWPLVYRDFCVMHLGLREPGLVELEFRDLAPGIWNDEAYALSIESFLAGFLDVCNVEGTVALELDLRTLEGLATFRWQEGA